MKTYQTIKTYGGVEVQLHALTSVSGQLHPLRQLYARLGGPQSRSGRGSPI